MFFAPGKPAELLGYVQKMVNVYIKFIQVPPSPSVVTVSLVQP